MLWVGFLQMLCEVVLMVERSCSPEYCRTTAELVFLAKAGIERDRRIYALILNMKGGLCAA